MGVRQVRGEQMCVLRVGQPFNSLVCLAWDRRGPDACLHADLNLQDRHVHYNPPLPPHLFVFFVVYVVFIHVCVFLCMNNKTELELGNYVYESLQGFPVFRADFSFCIFLRSKVCVSRRLWGRQMRDQHRRLRGQRLREQLHLCGRNQ